MKATRHAALAYKALQGIWPHEAAGLVETRLGRGARRGIVTSIYDAEPAGLDPAGGRWQTVCENHSHIISHETLATARSWLSHSDEWCEGCQDRAALDTRSGGVV